jgi:hypothetical protein
LQLFDTNWSAGANNTATTVISSALYAGTSIIKTIRTKVTGMFTGILKNFAEIAFDD